jgi:hypothetical protein
VPPQFANLTRPVFGAKWNAIRPPPLTPGYSPRAHFCGLAHRRYISPCWQPGIMPKKAVFQMPILAFAPLEGNNGDTDGKHGPGNGLQHVDLQYRCGQPVLRHQMGRRPRHGCDAHLQLPHERHRLVALPLQQRRRARLLLRPQRRADGRREGRNGQLGRGRQRSVHRSQRRPEHRRRDSLRLHRQHRLRLRGPGLPAVRRSHRRRRLVQLGRSIQCGYERLVLLRHDHPRVGPFPRPQPLVQSHAGARQPVLQRDELHREPVVGRRRQLRQLLPHDADVL